MLYPWITWENGIGLEKISNRLGKIDWEFPLKIGGTVVGSPAVLAKIRSERPIQSRTSGH
jgi:hypothetical protein